jgi:hypothetical protein
VSERPTDCGYCSFEESDGSLIEQCPKCRSIDEANSTHAQEVEEQEDALFLIYYDDRDMKPEILVGESGARARFAQVSVSWNAHLFGKIESNSHDSQFADANVKLREKDAETIGKIAQEAADYCMNLESTIAEQKRTILDMEAREKMLVESPQNINTCAHDEDHVAIGYAQDALDATPASTSEWTARFVAEWVRKNWKPVCHVTELASHSYGVPEGTQLYAIPDKASPESDIDQATRQC